MTATAGQQPTDHDVTVLHNTARTWCCACSCGWRSLDYIAEHAARRIAAEHYIDAGGAADDDSRELLASTRGLLASMRRHPAGHGAALADAIVVGCWQSDPPRAARRLLELPPDQQRACMVALGYISGGTGQ